MRVAANGVECREYYNHATVIGAIQEPVLFASTTGACTDESAARLTVWCKELDSVLVQERVLVDVRTL